MFITVQSEAWIFVNRESAIYRITNVRADCRAKGHQGKPTLSIAQTDIGITPLDQQCVRPWILLNGKLLQSLSNALLIVQSPMKESQPNDRLAIEILGDLTLSVLGLSKHSGYSYVSGLSSSSTKSCGGSAIVRQSQ